MYMKNAQIASKVQGQADRTSLFSRPSFTFDSDRPQNTGDSNYIRCKDFSVGCGARLGARSGFTLMELMVYIAIMGIVVIVAGQAFSNSTKFRVRNQSMIEANEVAGNIAALIKDDVAQMGAKSAVDPAGSTASGNAFVLKSDVFMDPGNSDDAKKDSSSYNLNETHDLLTFRRIQYLNTGAFNRVEEVSWYAKNGTLYRSCKTVVGTPDADNCPKDKAVEVSMAEGVSRFVVNPIRLDSSKILFPDKSDLTNEEFRLIPRSGIENYKYTNASPSDGAVAVSLSGFTTNYNESGTVPSNPSLHQLYVDEADGSTHTWNQCKKIQFKKDSIYKISFAMDYAEDASRMFRAGIDHFSVGVRKIDGEDAVGVDDVPDYFFYPPQDGTGQEGRAVEFSSKEGDFEGCLVFTFIFYSPTANMGRFTIRNLKIAQVVEISDVLKISDKKRVRSFNVELVVNKNGEAGTASISIPVPSNGV